MFIWPLLCSGIQAISTKGDYPPGARFRQNTTHLDVFMAMLMVVTIEVVILKIMTQEEDQEGRETSVGAWFNRFDPS